jgi:lysophospholipid acyltransferase (LPLAT)-like uncharacterized protein
MRERVLSFILWVFVKLVSATLRFRVIGDERRKALKAAGKPVIWAIWHGRQFLLYRFDPGDPLTVVTSPSRDGRLQAAVLRRFGMETVWGSSSRGGSRALIGLIRALRRGRDACIAVDGPRGPAYTVKRGIFFVAKKTGATVLPVVASARRCFRLKSWDRFLVPCPFTRAVVLVGDPIAVAPEAEEGDLERMRADLEAKMGALTAEADGYFAAKP